VAGVAEVAVGIEQPGSQQPIFTLDCKQGLLFYPNTLPLHTDRQQLHIGGEVNNPLHFSSDVFDDEPVTLPLKNLRK
jgi:hypothetical protein